MKSTDNIVFMMRLPNNDLLGYSEKYRKWYNITKNKFAKSDEIREVLKQYFNLEDEEAELVSSRTHPSELLKIREFYTEFKKIRYKKNADAVIYELSKKYTIRKYEVYDENNNLIFKNAKIAKKLKDLFEDYYSVDYNTIRKLKEKDALDKEVLDSLKIHSKKVKKLKIINALEYVFKRKKKKVYRIRVIVKNVRRISGGKYENDWIIESDEPQPIVLYASKIKGRCWECGLSDLLLDHFGIEVPLKRNCYIDRYYCDVYVETVYIDKDSVQELHFTKLYAFENCEWWIDALVEGL